MQPGGRERLIVLRIIVNDASKRWTKWCIYQKHLFITKPMWASGKAFTWCTCIVSDILQALKKETVYSLISLSMTCLSLTLNGWFTGCYSAPFHWKAQCSERGGTLKTLMSKIARAFSLSLHGQIQYERGTGRCASQKSLEMRRSSCFAKHGRTHPYVGVFSVFFFFFGNHSGKVEGGGGKVGWPDP